MTTLRDIFDYSEFQEAVYHGYIRVQTHPEFPELSIANYAEKAQFERFWTDEILASRGLIYNNQTLEVIARGFPKFFNFDDTSQPNPPVGPMIRSTKFDGSLGILYQDTLGDYNIATRGSFASDQAKHATKRFNEIIEEWGGETFSLTGFVKDFTLYEQIMWLVADGYTALFEIIYPQNRIVVDYHGEDRLVLLDVVDNSSGRSDLSKFDMLDWPDKADKQLIAGGFFDTIAGDIPAGEEGFVLYWPSHDFRCKVKSAEYVELHRMVTGLSEKVVWEMLGRGQNPDEIKEQIPDELFTWVDDVVVKLNDQAAAIIDTIYEDFDGLMAENTERLADSLRETGERGHRAAFARAASSPRYSKTRAYLFAVLDGAQPEDVWKSVWKTLKPVGDTRAFARAGEDVA